MKKIAFYLFLIAFPLVIVSCEDDEDSSTLADDNPGALVANIDGQSLDFRYQPRAFEGTYGIGDEIYDAIFISGATSIDFTKELQITIVNPVVGTFDLDIESSLSDIRYDMVFPEGSGIGYGSIAGTITVTELGNRIKGTFNATLYNLDEDVEMPINGSFDLGISD